MIKIAKQIGYVFDVKAEYDVILNDEGIKAISSCSGLVLSEYSDGRDVADILVLSDFIENKKDSHKIIKYGGLELLKKKYICDIRLINMKLLGAVSGLK